MQKYKIFIKNRGRIMSDFSKIKRIFFSIGLLLFASELWKQWVLTFILNDGVYDFWYFPFQLCSIPMYLLLMLPFLKSNSHKKVIFTFLMDYSSLSGIFVFFDTSGMRYPLISLTIHSYVWHIVLIMIGIGSGITLYKFYSSDFASFGKATGLFISCAVIAQCLNLSIGSHAQINMFYISPLEPATQNFFSLVYRNWGIGVYMIFYLGVIVLGAFLLHLLWKKVLL